MNVTTSILQEQFYRKGMRKDGKRICKGCLHYLPTRAENIIHRPLGRACHATAPGQVVHMDFLYIMPTKEQQVANDFKWVLALKDDFSGLVHLVPAAVPDTLITVQTLMEWSTTSGTPDIVSDQAAYFTSELMREYNKLCGVEQHWTTAWTHFPNGTVEVVNKHILALLREICSHVRWQKEEWSWLLKLVEYTLNHRPQKRLERRAPITVNTGRKHDTPSGRRTGSAETHWQLRKSSS